MERLGQVYGRVLSALSPVPWVAPLLAFVIFLSVLPAGRRLGLELVPDLFQGEFYYELELAEGTPLDTTDAKVAEIEQALGPIRDELGTIASTFVTVGGAPVLGDIRAGDRQDHLARINISMKPGTTRADEQAVIAALDRELARIPDCPSRLGRPTLFSFRDPIEVEVFCEELEPLGEAGRDVMARLRQVPELTDVRSSIAARSPEFHVDLDPVRLAAAGLSQGEVARILASKGLGEVPTQYTYGEKPIDIRVQVQGARQGTPKDVSNLSVARSEEGISMPLASIGELRQGLGPVEVRHVGGERAAIISARLAGADLGRASTEVDAALRDVELPPQVTARLSGQNDEMLESLRSLLTALALAVFLVYLVLASSFESLRLPFVIVLTVPLGVIGATLALAITGSTVSVFAMIGLILLCGIVVNNGIIYISRILQHRTGGQEAVQAVRQAGVERIRPILITSTTTILGLLPLALGFGAGAELRQPLALTVIGGLLVATVLTLLVIPSGYLILGGRRAAALDGSQS